MECRTSPNLPGSVGSTVLGKGTTSGGLERRRPGSPEAGTREIRRSQVVRSSADPVHHIRHAGPDVSVGRGQELPKRFGQTLPALPTANPSTLAQRRPGCSRQSCRTTWLLLPTQCPDNILRKLNSRLGQFTCGAIPTVSEPGPAVNNEPNPSFCRIHRSSAPSDPPPDGRTGRDCSEQPAALPMEFRRPCP